MSLNQREQTKETPKLNKNYIMLDLISSNKYNNTQIKHKWKIKLPSNKEYVNLIKEWNKGTTITRIEYNQPKIRLIHIKRVKINKQNKYKN